MKSLSKSQTSNWYKQATELYEMARAHGGLPPQSELEPRVVSWIKNQRRAANLDPSQIAALNRIPGWSWSPREDRWAQRLAELKHFRATHSRPPSTRAPGKSERALAVWWARQRRRIARNELPYHLLRLAESETGQLTEPTRGQED